jgi:hypothetical protein
LQKIAENGVVQKWCTSIYTNMWPFVDGQNDVLHHAMELENGTVNTDKPMWTVMTTHEGVVITCFY